MADTDYSTEEWRVIAEHPDFSVSSFGRVRRDVPTARGKKPGIKKASVNDDGYEVVTLYRDGAVKVRPVHRLVCLAFHGAAPSAAHQVAHGDGVRTNNAFSNLRWATAAENADDRAKHGTTVAGERNHLARITSEDARRIFADPRRYRDIAASFGVCFNTVSNIKCKRSWRAIHESLPPA